MQHATISSPAWNNLHFGRTLHLERFVRTLAIELLNEVIELGLLLEIAARRASRFFPLSERIA